MHPDSAHTPPSLLLRVARHRWCIDGCRSIDGRGSIDGSRRDGSTTRRTGPPDLHHSFYNEFSDSLYRDLFVVREDMAAIHRSLYRDLFVVREGIFVFPSIVRVLWVLVQEVIPVLVVEVV